MESLGTLTGEIRREWLDSRFNSVGDFNYASNSLVKTAQPITAQPIKVAKVNMPSTRKTGRRPPIPPPPRATPTSSSGYPGVSWNKRMGAWLAFYYDNDTRRSRTFHPKYFDMDVERAKMAAVEFMKTIEKHPRCRLRKLRREAPKREDQFPKRRPSEEGFKDPLFNRSPLSCSSQASEVYDLEQLKRSYMLNSHSAQGYFNGEAEAVWNPASQLGSQITASNLAGSQLGSQLAGSQLGSQFGSQLTTGQLAGGQLGGQLTSSQLTAGQPNYLQPTACQNFYIGQQEMPHTPLTLTGSAGHSQPSCLFDHSVFDALNSFESKRGDSDHSCNYYEQSMSMFYDSPHNEDLKLKRFMQSVATSPNDSYDGFKNLLVQNSFDNLQPFCSQNNMTPLGSPYLSPYPNVVYGQEEEFGRDPYSQQLGREGARRHCLQSPCSPFDLPIDSKL